MIKLLIMIIIKVIVEVIFGEGKVFWDISILLFRYAGICENLGVYFIIVFFKMYMYVLYMFFYEWYIL